VRVGRLRQPPCMRGDIDHRRIVDALRHAGYERDLTIEDEFLGQFPSDQRVRILRKDIEFVKRLI
jgi:sugar phosphate isomerase/epimerase